MLSMVTRLHYCTVGLAMSGIPQAVSHLRSRRHCKGYGVLATAKGVVVKVKNETRLAITAVSGWTLRTARRDDMTAPLNRVWRRLPRS